MLARQDKALVTVIAGLTLAAVTALAVGIGSLQLKLGRPLVLDELGRGSAADLISQIQLPSALLGLLGSALRIGALVLLPFAILHFIRSPAARRQVLLQLFYLVIFSLAVLSLSQSFGPQQLNPPILPAPQAALPQPGADFSADLPQAPRWLISVASLLGAVLLVFLGYRSYRAARPERSSTDRLAAGAQQALLDIEAGHRLENVVLRAYFQLCEASWRRRGLSRARHQTAREYGGRLRTAGIPEAALDQLTRLFERARYGGAPLNEEDEHQAIAALRTILRSLGEL